MSDRLQRIRACLVDALAPVQMELLDDSARHRGHEGARDGRGHFKLHVVADCFAGEAPLARHRRVYQALGALMQTDIHALNIHAQTPAEAGL